METWKMDLKMAESSSLQARRIEGKEPRQTQVRVEQISNKAFFVCIGYWLWSRIIINLCSVDFWPNQPLGFPCGQCEKRLSLNKRTWHPYHYCSSIDCRGVGFAHKEGCRHLLIAWWSPLGEGVGFLVDDSSQYTYVADPPEFRTTKMEIPRSENENSAIKKSKFCAQK